MTGVDKLHAEGHFGAGIKIGVIDTGIDYTHPNRERLFSTSYFHFRFRFHFHFLFLIPIYFPFPISCFLFRLIYGELICFAISVFLQWEDALVQDARLLVVTTLLATTIMDRTRLSQITTLW
jgi:hypothetical protein